MIAFQRQGFQVIVREILRFRKKFLDSGSGKKLFWKKALHHKRAQEKFNTAGVLLKKKSVLREERSWPKGRKPEI